jgi:hypothetical protein
VERFFHGWVNVFIFLGSFKILRYGQRTDSWRLKCSADIGNADFFWIPFDPISHLAFTMPATDGPGIKRFEIISQML